MNRFADDVWRAYVDVYEYLRKKTGNLILARMREKYFDGQEYVYPDEMIEKVNEFSVDELIEFLHYCVFYKERFCDGIYGLYASEGLIGQILKRLKNCGNAFS